jgi:hypothetical protein
MRKSEILVQKKRNFEVLVVGKSALTPQEMKVCYNILSSYIIISNSIFYNLIFPVELFVRKVYLLLLSLYTIRYNTYTIRYDTNTNLLRHLV